MDAHSCCDPEICIRREIASLLDPDSPIIDRIYVAACAVAATCGDLTPEELNTCAGKMFEVTPECHLAKAFIIAYQTERDARSGRRDLERLRAALEKSAD